MLALTSLSPSHRNQDVQAACMASWIEAGFKPISLNHPDEIAQLKGDYKGVQFVPTRSTMEATFGRPFVRISALIDYAKDSAEDHFLFINSDILIKDDDGLTTEHLKMWSDSHFIFIHRFDYENSTEVTARYDQGMDGFFVHKKFLDKFPQSLLCMGQTHWDYWFPYMAQKRGIPLKRITEKYLFHKVHPVQYSVDNWQLTAQYARTECELWGAQKAPNISAVMYQQIMRKSQ